MNLVRLVLAAVMVVVASVATSVNEGDSVKVALTQGVLEGVALPMVAVGGKDTAATASRFYYSFRGIPFAQPPVGKLRFKDPAPAGGWEGVRAPFTPPPCPQMDIIGMIQGTFSLSGEEDCLYLHVYTPKMDETDPLPVLVYIHGGGFAFGDGDNAGGSALPLVTKDVVVVSLQYRLGALGFISTGDSVLPGNMGLKDQTLALRWVQDNIQKFGGDAARVTILGESAGAASVHFQMFSPAAEGLFQRAILQSGTSLCPWALRHDHRQSAIGVGKALGCPGVEGDQVDSTALLECLMEMPSEKLVAVGSMSTGEEPHSIFVPRVDGEYLPDHPATLLAKGRYHKVDLISGVTKDEGAISMPNMVMKLNAAEGGMTVGDLVPIGPELLCFDEEGVGAEDMSTRALYHYLGKEDTPLTLQRSTTDVLVKMLSDVVFKMQHEDIGRYHARDAIHNNSVYFYQLDHRAPDTLCTLFGLTIENDWVCHGDELQYLFTGVYGFKPLERSQEQVLRNIMVQLWTSFAATGNPTPDMSLGFRWSPASTSNLQYLSLTPAARMMPDPQDEDREFLRSLPTLHQRLLRPKDFTAYSPSSHSSSSSSASSEHGVETEATLSCCTVSLMVLIFVASLYFVSGLSSSSSS